MNQTQLNIIFQFLPCSHYKLFTICVAIVREARIVCEISGLIKYIFVLMQILHQNEIPLSRIAALVFDTTTINSGQNKGICCSTRIRATTSPQQEEFKKLVLLWPELNSNYSPIKLHHNQRGLKSLAIDTTDFLHNWIANSSNSKLRQDYLELAQLDLLFLGGNLPSGATFLFQAPSAYHHA